MPERGERMKGLVIKDIMCLKKQLTTFAFVIAGVVIVSVMYVLSTRFGNLAKVGVALLDENNNMSEIDVKNLGSMALVLFMFLPIVSVGDMINVFMADGKAGFVKVSASFPVPLKNRLLARFITIFSLLGIGALADILLAGMLCMLTDIMSFGEFFGVIISVSSLMCIYSALVILFCIMLGYGKEQYAQCFSLLSMAAAFIIVRFKDLKSVFIRIFIEEHGFDSDTFWQPLDFFKEKGYVFFFIAVFVMILSYMISLNIAERKRGVI